MLQKTPLYETHLKYGAKVVPFGGWAMPVSYKSVISEHHAVRNSCGLFDVSHMGEITVSGTKSFDFLQAHTINDLRKLSVGKGQYSALLNHNGGIIDDIIIYQRGGDSYFICVNASNIQKDFEWLDIQAKKWSSNVLVRNESNNWGQLAIQGPNSEQALKPLLKDSDLVGLKYMEIREINIQQWKGALARTGYTGERGYELYLPPMALTYCWERIMETAPLTQVQPIGLGARDTLRLESCYLLYGNDMDENSTPLEAGISWACKLDKGNFIGRESLINQKSKPLSKLIFAFKMLEDGIPRHDMDAYTNDNQPLGKITSGSVLPSVGGAGGMASLDPRKVKLGDHFLVDIRGNKKLAQIVSKPLYAAKVKD
jgi:aminomethyltransferase